MEPEPERGDPAPPGPPGPLEPRLRRLEEELALVKAALGDALRRLGLYEQHLPRLLRHLPHANGAIPEPFVPPAAAGPPPAPPCRPHGVSVGTQTDEGSPVAPGGGGDRGGPQEPPPPGSPPCPPAPSPASPEPQAPESPPAAPSPAPQGARKELLRRHSSSSGSSSPRRRLSRKAASSANLLLPVGSPESRPKEPVMSPGSRRANYNLEGVSVKMFLRGRPITMYVPSGLGPYVGLRAELPPERLQLDWVYGYRGRDSRSNLHVLASGELVYFIACVVVLLHVPHRRQRHYLRHSDCVRCLAVHPDRLRVATGQAAGVDKDGKPLQPVVHIWDSATLLTLQQIGLGSFERGVGSLAFSTADQGAHLCVVDDSNEHMMSVWDCARGTKLAEVKSTNESVLSVEFNPQDSGSIITSGKSHVYFWTWSGAALTKKQGIFGKYKKPKFIQCFVFDAAGDVLTGDSEGNILTWTRAAGPAGKGGKETYQIGQQTRAHEGSVFALCRRRDGTVLSGGGKDRRVLSWSPALALLQEAELPERFGAVRTIAEGPGEELLVGTTRNALLRGTLADGFTPIVQGHTDEVWGLATHPSRCLFLTCGHDRQLCLWDGHEHALAWSLALEDTGLCADFHPGGQVVAVGLLTGRWLVLDTETQQPLAGGSDGNEQLSVVRFSPALKNPRWGPRRRLLPGHRLPRQRHLHLQRRRGRPQVHPLRALHGALQLHHPLGLVQGRPLRHVQLGGLRDPLLGRRRGLQTPPEPLREPGPRVGVLHLRPGLPRLRCLARRLGRHRHQLPVPLAPRARGGRGRRLLQGAPLPVPLRPAQGTEPRLRGPRQPRHQRALHPRRRAPGVAGGQGHQRLPVAGAGGAPGARPLPRAPRGGRGAPLSRARGRPRYPPTRDQGGPRPPPQIKPWSRRPAPRLLPAAVTGPRFRSMPGSGRPFPGSGGRWNGSVPEALGVGGGIGSGKARRRPEGVPEIPEPRSGSARGSGGTYRAPSGRTRRRAETAPEAPELFPSSLRRFPRPLRKLPRRQRSRSEKSRVCPETPEAVARPFRKQPSLSESPRGCSEAVPEAAERLRKLPRP